MNKNCPQCGTLVNNDLPGGLCPACLMAAARQSQDELAGTTALPTDFQAPSIAEISRLFPELEILQLIGRGGMGAVYKVRQKNLDRIVALKVFLYRPDDAEFAARFQREARALAKLNHPNIVTVHDFGIREKTHFLIMEYVDGLNLRQLTEGETLAPEMALQMVPQLCDALQYAHDHGVIHRDIKPENLLLDAKGKVNIADFGLAKMTCNDGNGSLTRTQQVMGTYNYMAPEQRERPTEVDHRADIYSLGVVIYEMLTGELPIGRFQPPSSKSSVDGRLDEVVMRALEKEPERRYQQASQFKTGFESVGTGTGNGNGHLAPVPPVKQTDRPIGTRCLITLMSGQEKKGNWHPGDPQLAMTMWGGTVLDLTNVSVTYVNLTLLTLMGGVEVIVPHGATVDLDGFILMGATVNKVAAGEGTSNLHVRIKSWGAMGACEVRSPTQKELGVQNKIAKPPRKQPEHKITIAGGMVLLYKLFMMLVSIAIPIIFLMIPFSNFPKTNCIVMGIFAALLCGFLGAGLGYFRILVGAGPESDDEEAWIEYESATKLGTSIRWFGLVFAFACPALIIVSVFNYPNGFGLGKDEMMFAGIVCAIFSGLVIASAGFLEEFFYGKKA